MQIRGYGKNKRELKKLIKAGSKIYWGNQENKLNDFTESFMNVLLGYDYIFKKHKKGLEIIDCSGESFILETDQEIEII